MVEMNVVADARVLPQKGMPQSRRLKLRLAVQHLRKNVVRMLMRVAGQRAQGLEFRPRTEPCFEIFRGA